VSASAISPAEGFMAEHAHYDDDAGFWEGLADRLGGPVCDLGAAAGRVTVRVAARGHQVWAVDTDPEMLAVLAQRAARHGVPERVHGVRQSMVDPLPVQDAGLVVIPMNTLQVLRDPADRTACMGACAAALRPGGEMAFDLAMPHFDVVGGLLGTLLDTGHGIDPETGDLLLHTAMFDDLDRARGDVRLRIMVERIHRDGTSTRVERPHHLHLYEPDEIPALAAAAGLDVLQAAGGFHGEPLTGSSERQVWRLGRPR